MEHCRSTLATATAATSGLAIAARVLHPGGFEDTPRAAPPILAEATAHSSPTVTRLDPPSGLYMRPGASYSETAMLARRLTAPPLAGMAMMPVLAAGMTTVGDASREARPLHRDKDIPHSVRARPAAAPARTARAAPPDDRSPAAGTPYVRTYEPVRDVEG